MKLVRGTTFNAESEFRKLRGNTHYYTIENAPPADLEAIDEILTKAGWDNDNCADYDGGISCGYWIDIEEVAAFKAAYKSAKAGIRDYINELIETEHPTLFEWSRIKVNAEKRYAEFFGRHDVIARRAIVDAAHTEALEINAINNSAAQHAITTRELQAVQAGYTAAQIATMNALELAAAAGAGDANGGTDNPEYIAYEASEAALMIATNNLLKVAGRYAIEVAQLQGKSVSDIDALRVLFIPAATDQVENYPADRRNRLVDMALKLGR